MNRPGQPDQNAIWSHDPRKAARRKRLVRWLPPFLTGVIRVLAATLRCSILVPPSTRRLFRSGKPFLLAFWHGKILLMQRVFLPQIRNPRDVWTLISRHWDGEIIARTVEPFGVRAVRGSSTQGGREAFKEMCDRIRAGSIVAITPDGPRGPRFRVQSGIVRVSRETGVPIVPVSWSAKPHVRMWTWDRFQIPLPFSRVFAAFGEPLFPDDSGEDSNSEQYRRLLEDRLNVLNHETAGRAAEARAMAWLSLGYNVLLLLATILGLPFILWKLFSVRKLRAGFLQKLGLYRSSAREGGGMRRPIWVHAVSVGEVLATVPLVQRFRKAHGEFPLVISTITPTGQAMALNRFGEAARIVYFPFDYPVSTRLALRSVRPRLFVHTETEIWPNFLFSLGQIDIPSAIVNGRISSKSCRNYVFFRFFFRRVLSNISVFGMQSRLDCHRVIRIGADPRRVRVTGNMKFDVPLPQVRSGYFEAVRQDMGFSAEDLIFVAGSTHAGEEEILFDVYRRLRADLPALRMLMAPRHPERCEDVIRIAAGKGIAMERRTYRRDKGGKIESDVLLLDTIGELARVYSIGDIVFVGGTLVPVGGHNLLEPIMFKKPVLFGPHTENTADVAGRLKHVGGGIEVVDIDSLCHEARRLLADNHLREEAGKAAFGILEENRGAAERNLAVLEPLLEYE